MKFERKNDKNLLITDNGDTIELSDNICDDIYRAVRFDYVCEDIRCMAESRMEDGDISDEIVKAAANLYVYEGDYDCNDDYWTQLEKVVNEAKEEK